ncbi:MAG TPA: ion channel [Nocardioidaceae bacterium]|nr:ion channel [Nocardioidaceae bacterium]
MTEEPARTSPSGLPRLILQLLQQTTFVLVLLTACYYVIPLSVEWQDLTDLMRVAASVLLAAGVALVFRAHARRSERILGKDLVRIQWLLSALYLLVLAFAMTYSVVSRFAPDQFVGVRDRTAALYFSTTIVATVGFGDIHAAGTLAQVLVTMQMLFNLIYLGTALRLLSRRASSGDSPF